MGERLNFEFVDLEIILIQNGFGVEVNKIKEKYKKSFPQNPRRRKYYEKNEFEEVYNKYGPFH